MQNLNNTYPLATLVERVGGTVIGNSSLTIVGLCPLDTPQENHITFIRTSSTETLTRQVAKLNNIAVLVPEALAGEIALPPSVALISVKESYSAFLDLVPFFFKEILPPPGIHPTAAVDPSAHIAEGVSIGAFCVIGPRTSIGKGTVLYSHVRVHEDVMLGEGCKIYSGVSLRSGTKLGARVTIHDNAVIGADGFGYTPDPKVGLRKVPQVGHVEIASDVEIGANTCIDRGAFGVTSIGQGTKIDNLVQIGHNTSIGSFTIVCGQAAIAGSTKIGDQVIIGGSVGIADHIEVFSGVRVGGGAAVINSLKEPGDYLGSPAIKASEWKRIQVSLRKMVKRK